jgi:hypothetical protein
MTIYQKAIKVKKECESRKVCGDCIYCYYCATTNILLYSPAFETIEVIAKAIEEEKWNVK